MGGRQLEGASCLHEEEKKITSVPFWFLSKTFWKIPWGTLQSMFCHAALGKVFFQECSFKCGLRTWTIFTCARLWFWNQKAGLSQLLHNCGHLISEPKLLSLHQAVLHHMDLPGHFCLTVGLCVLLHDVLLIVGSLLNEEPSPSAHGTNSFSV